MAEVIYYCPDLTLYQAWKQLQELTYTESLSIAYNQIHEAFLPDLKAFVVGKTQPGIAQENAVAWYTFIEWLHKIFIGDFLIKSISKWNPSAPFLSVPNHEKALQQLPLSENSRRWLAR